MCFFPFEEVEVMQKIRIAEAMTLHQDVAHDESQYGVQHIFGQ